jgi:hypothetical protein
MRRSFRRRAPILLLSFTMALVALPDAAADACTQDSGSLSSLAQGSGYWNEINVAGLTPGQSVTYQWGVTTQGSLYFDVHYHESNGTNVFVVVPSTSTGSSGSFVVPPGHNNLSALWQNPPTQAQSVDYSYSFCTASSGQHSFLPAPPVSASVLALVAVAAVATRHAASRAE